MYAEIDSENYFTGNSVTLGGMTANIGCTIIECDSLPDYAIYYQQLSCKWDSSTSSWVYDADKYAEYKEQEELEWNPSVWGDGLAVQAKIEYLGMMGNYELYTDIEGETKFKKVRSYHHYSYWTSNMIKNAVVKGWITSDEYKTITGEDYITN